MGETEKSIRLKAVVVAWSREAIFFSKSAKEKSLGTSSATGMRKVAQCSAMRAIWEKRGFSHFSINLPPLIFLLETDVP